MVCIWVCLYVVEWPCPFFVPNVVTEYLSGHCSYSVTIVYIQFGISWSSHQQVGFHFLITYLQTLTQVPPNQNLRWRRGNSIKVGLVSFLIKQFCFSLMPGLPLDM